MLGKRSRSLSLTFKVDFLLIAALALGIGAVMAAFTLSLVDFRDQLTTQSLKRQGDDHFVAVETLMLSGNAPEARNSSSGMTAVSFSPEAGPISGLIDH